MPKNFLVRDNESEKRQQGVGARHGFIGAFVRSVQRGPQSSAGGKMMISALVMVLTAASVVGLGVLLKGIGKPATDSTAAAAVTSGTRNASASAPGRTGNPGRPGEPGVSGTNGGRSAPGVPGGPSALTPIRVAGEVGNPTSAMSTTTTSGGVPVSATNGGAKNPIVTASTNPASTTTKKQTVAKPAAPTPAEVAIIGYGSGRCIDVTGGAYQSNPQLQIWTCTGGPNQQWRFYGDGTVRAFGLCMTVDGNSSANGAKIRLQTCSSSKYQQFELKSTHDLVNHNAGKCVDVLNKGTASGTPLQLWQCTGTSNQKWHE